MSYHANSMCRAPICFIGDFIAAQNIGLQLILQPNIMKAKKKKIDVKKPEDLGLDFVRPLIVNKPGLMM